MTPIATLQLVSKLAAKQVVLPSGLRLLEIDRVCHVSVIVLVTSVACHLVSLLRTVVLIVIASVSMQASPRFQVRLLYHH